MSKQYTFNSSLKDTIDFYNFDKHQLGHFQFLIKGYFNRLKLEYARAIRLSIPH